MTANQLAYWKLQEEKRSNLATEKEQHRHNMVDESNKMAATATKGFTDLIGSGVKLLLG